MPLRLPVKQCPRIRDHNYRIHADRGEIHLLGRQLHLRSANPMRLMRQLQQRLAQDTSRKALTTEHAFYLGYEMSKASIAMALGKNYEQDEPLDWGMLTRPQEQHWYHPPGQDPSP